VTLEYGKINQSHRHHLQVALPAQVRAEDLE